ncbi:hypothetical protein ACFL6S_17340 [Candidatus Poribacteria bacterium]
MKKSWLIAVVPGVLGVIVGLFILALLLLKILWGWAIPDLFPGAVEQGLVARSISWYTAFKMAIFVAVLGGVAGLSKSGSHNSHG